MWKKELQQKEQQPKAPQRAEAEAIYAEMQAQTERAKKLAEAELMAMAKIWRAEKDVEQGEGRDEVAREKLEYHDKALSAAEKARADAEEARSAAEVDRASAEAAVAATKAAEESARRGADEAQAERDATRAEVDSRRGAVRESTAAGLELRAG